MRTAIIHDWLITYGGAERSLERILKIFPDADLFALYDFVPEGKRDFILNKKSTVSFLQKFPFARKKYRSYLPFMPLAVEQFDLSGYDLIISSSFAVAKGVITGPDQLHISYVYTPMRYAWDLTHQYLRESGLDRGPRGFIAKSVLHYIRNWDARTANGVDHFGCISKFVARRIRKVYRRSAEVIYPPVNTDSFTLNPNKDDFYFTVSRMVPYKKIDLIVEAFSRMPDKRLIVIGDGPDFNKIKRKAGSNIELLGYQPSEVVREYMQKARALVFAAEEDFGIVPVEAQACGTPVIAYGKGGVLETVIENETGIFFDEQTVDSLIGAVDQFEEQSSRFNPQKMRENALRFSAGQFDTGFKAFAEKIIDAHYGQKDITVPRRLIIKSAAKAVRDTEEP